VSNHEQATGQAEAGEAEAGGTAPDDIERDALLSRLRIIEDQPLETRAASFAQIHEELQSRLESGDAVSAS
jgi:hypothetical protein